MASNLSNTKTSKELLSITGDGSQKAVIKSLFKKPEEKLPTTKPNICKVTQSSLLGEVKQFLPRMRVSTSALVNQPEEEKIKLDIENVEDCDEVVEMDILMGKYLQDDTDEDSSSSEDDIMTNTEDPQQAAAAATTQKKKLVQVLNEANSDGER